MAVQVCKDTTEAVELYESLGIYLKPIAKINVCVQLPVLKTPGKSISSWEVMEKLKKMIIPEEFTSLKVTKTTLEFIRFEGELEKKGSIKSVLSKLENTTIKLSGFPDMLKVRAAEAKIIFPTRYDWDSFFRDAKNVDEMKPGERPDTIHFQNLPLRWFVNPKCDPEKPSEQVLRKVFEVFGDIRCICIPMLDPYLRNASKISGKINTFSFGQDLTFEAYVQYKEYMGFVKAMDTLRGMKLMYQSLDGKAHTANIKVDFDRTKYLSERNIKKRKLELEKMVIMEKEHQAKKEQEERQQENRKKQEERLQEEKEKLKSKKEWECQRLMELKRQKKERKTCRRALEKRKIETSYLLGELLQRVKVVKLEEEAQRKKQEIEQERLRQKELEKRRLQEEARRKEEEEKQRQEKLHQQEKLLREKLLRSLKAREEKRTEELREKLRKELSGRNVLRSVLVTTKTLTWNDLSSKRSPKLKSFCNRY